MTRRQAAPAVTFVLLLAVYSMTLAPGVTLWDSGEFLAAVKTLGIPHPAGTALFVLVSKCWSFAFAPILGFARSMNLFSAACTAAACGLIAALFARWTDDTVSGVCAGLVAGATSTIWLSATETEVYALAFLLGTLLLFVGDLAGRSGESRWALLSAYLAGLGWPLHLAALVVLPAAGLLIFSARSGSPRFPDIETHRGGRAAHRSHRRLIFAAILLAVAGASCALYLLVRARHDPAINQGNPSTLSALWDVVTRRQYGTRTLWPRSVPLYLQIGNLFEYADWQFALGLSDAPGPSPLRTAVTIIYAALGVYGCVIHRRKDRRSWRAWVLLLIAGSVGAILYLNLKAGPSYGAGFVSSDAHEARERDYFFFFAFAAWGAWAGVAIARLSKLVTPSLKSVPLFLAAIPFALNWNAVNRSSRSEDVMARESALGMLLPLPPRAVMLAIGDNDTYPLWYLQQVEHVRRDVTVVTIPLLSAAWYRAELARRHQLLDAGAPGRWDGPDAAIRSVRAHAATLARPVVSSPFLRAAPE